MFSRGVPGGLCWFKRTSQVHGAKVTVFVNVCQHAVAHYQLTRHRRWQGFGILPKAALG
jgi:hypothetical protein